MIKASPFRQAASLGLRDYLGGSLDAEKLRGPTKPATIPAVTTFVSIGPA